MKRGTSPWAVWHSCARVRSFIALVFLVLVCGMDATPGSAQPMGGAGAYPATGTIAAPLAPVEAEILAFLEAHGIPGAIFALSRKGELLAQRGYGWRDRSLSEPMPADARMRIASITKPVVAAAVHALVQEGALSLDAYAFDLGQSGGGILPVDPFPELSDSRLAQITVRQLLNHTAGWDRSEVGDWTYQEVQVAAAMGLNGSPGRKNMMNYILGQPLQFSPGQRESYSNIGYLAAGLVVEHVAGQDLMSVIHQRVLGPLGVGQDEYMQGATFLENQHPSEPFYHAPELRVNVFDPSGPRVEHPYGGWDHEMRIGQGGHIATAAALVAFLDHRYIAGPNMGTPIPANAGSGWRWNHQGSLPGTTALARQRGDGISYAIVFNQRHSSNGASQIRDRIDAVLDSGIIDWDLRDVSPPEPAGWSDRSYGVEVRLALLAEQGDIINNAMSTSMDRSLMERLGLEQGQKVEVGIGDRSALYTLARPRDEGGDVLRMGRAARQRLGETEPFEGRIAPAENIQVERALFSLGLDEVVSNSGYAAVDVSLMERLGLAMGDRIMLRPENRVDDSAVFTIVEILDEGQEVVRIGLSGRRRLNENNPFRAYISHARGSDRR